MGPPEIGLFNLALNTSSNVHAVGIERLKNDDIIARDAEENGNGKAAHAPLAEIDACKACVHSASVRLPGNEFNGAFDFAHKLQCGA